MRRHGGQRSDFSRWFGPLGVLTIVVVALIGWVAYEANSGLPGQSRYKVNVLVPDADRLINAADVRIGGVLVGEVLGITAERGSAGAPPDASVKLALNDSVGRLPLDSTVQIRPASVLGLTYVDLTLGRSRQTVAPGGTLPLSQAKPSSDLTDLFQIFNHSAARGFQNSVSGIAYGLAGRGPALNSAIASTASLLPALTDVMRTLAAPATEFARFLSGYEATVAALGPVSDQFADLISNAATTLGALAGVRSALGDAIDAAPGAESATTTAFTTARPALDGLARLAVDLRPAGAQLPRTLAQTNLTLTAGLPALRAIPSFSRPLRTALQTLEAFARDPNTSAALRKLLDLTIPTNAVLDSFLTAQGNCNAISQWAINFSSNFIGLGDGVGPALPDLTITGVGAQLEPLQDKSPSPNLNTDPLPYENQTQCQAGNEPFTGKQQLNNVPGPTSRTTRTTVPPPGVEALARAAGLLKPVPGATQ